MKDYFSGHSKLYATFRPTYPDDLYQFIFKHIKEKSCAWDCATGNGQVAQRLSNDFETVYATDISQQQLDNAQVKNNIFYSVSPAEKTSFTDNQFDLITVGQALHWFNLTEFYKEVKRVGKNNSTLAVWGYALCTVNLNIDKLFLDFYNNIVGPYWDNARKLVENEYADIPFPFETITTPKFYIRVEWTFDQFIGYLSTWSATQKYIQTNQINPVISFSEKLIEHWTPDEKKEVSFPVFLKLGTI